MHLADAFIQSDLQCIQAIHFVSMWGVFPGNRTHNLCAANAMLYWATGTHTHTLSLHTLSLTHTQTQRLSHTLTHTNTETLSHTHSLTYTHTLSLSLSHTHTDRQRLSHTHTHTHTLSLTHTHLLCFRRNVNSTFQRIPPFLNVSKSTKGCNNFKKSQHSKLI